MGANLDEFPDDESLRGALEKHPELKAFLQSAPPKVLKSGLTHHPDFVPALTGSAPTPGRARPGQTARKGPLTPTAPTSRLTPGFLGEDAPAPTKSGPVASPAAHSEWGAPAVSSPSPTRPKPMGRYNWQSGKVEPLPTPSALKSDIFSHGDVPPPSGETPAQSGEDVKHLPAPPYPRHWVSPPPPAPWGPGVRTPREKAPGGATPSPPKEGSSALHPTQFGGAAGPHPYQAAATHATYRAAGQLLSQPSVGGLMHFAFGHHLAPIHRAMAQDQAAQSREARLNAAEASRIGVRKATVGLTEERTRLAAAQRGGIEARAVRTRVLNAKDRAKAAKRGEPLEL